MFRNLKVAGIALLAVLALAPAASAQRARVGSRGFGFRGPVFRSYAYPYGYGAWWPGWGWGWESPYYYGPATGNVKLVSPQKDAMVYVDGGFAGRADKLKKFPLTLGTHDIELRDGSGHTFHQERVQIIRGKTIEVNAS